MDVTFHSMSTVTFFRRMEDRPSYLAGARAGLAFALPTLVVGISFGALARSLGWGEVAPVVASVLVFSASAQFGIASVLAAGGGHVAALLAAALVNARFLPMGIAVAGSLRGGHFRRAVEGQAVVDASWALASRGDGRFDRCLLIGRRSRSSSPGSAEPPSAWRRRRRLRIPSASVWTSSSRPSFLFLS
jgi:hypothetical protein